VPPANKPDQATTGPENSSVLFSPGYVFGEPIYPIEENPPAAYTPPATPNEPEPEWTTVQAQQEPTPAATTQATPQANSRWFFYSGASSLQMQLPNGEDIRSVYIPNLPQYNNEGTLVYGPVALYYGAAAGGNPFYVAGSGLGGGGEVVPVPFGNRVISVNSSTQFPVVDGCYIFVTSEQWPPNKFLPPVVTVVEQE
jgi:hypothetical protein